MLPALSVALRHARVRRIPPGQIIIRSNERAVELYIIKSGNVVICPDTSPQAMRSILTILSVGSLIPLFFLTSSIHTTNWEYIAYDACDLYVLDPEQVIADINTSPQLANEILGWLAGEADKLLSRVEGLEQSSTTAKVEMALKYLATYHSRSAGHGWRRIAFPMSHYLVANMVGASRATTSRILKELERQKKVRRAGHRTLDIRLES